MGLRADEKRRKNDPETAGITPATGKPDPYPAPPVAHAAAEVIRKLPRYAPKVVYGFEGLASHAGMMRDDENGEWISRDDALACLTAPAYESGESGCFDRDILSELPSPQAGAGPQEKKRHACVDFVWQSVPAGPERSGMPEHDECSECGALRSMACREDNHDWCHNRSTPEASCRCECHEPKSPLPSGDHAALIAAARDLFDQAADESGNIENEDGACVACGQRSHKGEPHTATCAIDRLRTLAALRGAR